ncbi:MAG: hypothetical protein HQL50_14280 [Magnetococcales bacterium]|nr:hypothetical protein [Magnetococcales bacterium]
MSSPLRELQSLLTDRRPISGKVVEISGDMVRVATAHGMVEVGGTGLQIGEAVMVRDGVAVRVQGLADAPVFRV